MREIGVHVVLDDFGAGYSSLQMLKSLPLDKIKIDRSLLQDVGRTAAADAILGAILRLSRTLDLKVAAEGVETQEQLAVLRREKCEELQGYLLGRPAPIAAYERFVSGRRSANRPDRIAPFRGATAQNCHRSILAPAADPQRAARGDR